MSKEPKNLLITVQHERQLQAFAQQYFKGRLLDIGCGIKPHRDLLSGYVIEHIGLDHVEGFHNKANVDLFGTAFSIPAPDNSFDSVLSTSVLEHLEEPELALRECFRVLKNNGIAIYGVPFIWRIREEPRDFYRFSKYGINYLFSKTRFDVIKIKEISGFWGTFGQMFFYYIYKFNRGPLRWLRIIDYIVICIQGIPFFLDKLDAGKRWSAIYGRS